jgi:hypothetical protein
MAPPAAVKFPQSIPPQKGEGAAWGSVGARAAGLGDTLERWTPPLPLRGEGMGVGGGCK